MNSPVLKVEGVNKKYCKNFKKSLYYGLVDLIDQVFLLERDRSTLRKDEFWALRDISFELFKGQTLGIIGHNGAGKSSILKLINGLLIPDSGTITIHGRVGALIELGAGFNPVLTGRENIYINAAVLGIPKAEIDTRIEDIIQFADLDEFIDAPVQSYSSGMKVRLGYSVATNLNPDIMLIDEILSVGDESFRHKCINNLRGFKENGGSIIFISHNMAAMEAISDQVMLLDHGKIIALGEPGEIIKLYERKCIESPSYRKEKCPESPDTHMEDIIIKSAHCLDDAGKPIEHLDYGESLRVVIEYELISCEGTPGFVLGLKKEKIDCGYISVVSSKWDGYEFQDFPGKGKIICDFCRLNLSPGLYSIYIGVQKESSLLFGKKWYSPMKKYSSFLIKHDTIEHMMPGILKTDLIGGMAPVILEHTWQLIR